MKKLFAITLLGLAGLTLTAGQASAGWLFHCNSKCYVNLRCKQYNAFSPYCCEFLPAGCPTPSYVPNPAFFDGHHGDGCYAGGGGCTGEVVAGPSMPGAYAGSMPTTMPTPNAPAGNGYMAAAPGMPSARMQGVPPQGWQNWNPNMMNPYGMSSTYPGSAPYVPANNMGR